MCNLFSLGLLVRYCTLSMPVQSAGKWGGKAANAAEHPFKTELLSFFSLLDSRLKIVRDC